jgi:glycine hydroxymethyltransferase
MGLGLPFGGHLTHGANVNFSARFFTPVQYAVTREGLIDYKELRELARKEKPDLIVAGITAYSRVLDFAKFAKIAREVDAWLFADVSHISGLIVAGVHPSPFSYADVVMTTTHKSLRGPRGALIFVNRKSKLAKKKGIDIAAAIDKAVFPGLQGGPHDNQTTAIAVALGEAIKPTFKKYGVQIVKNARVLATELQRLGFNIVSGGTDNHMLLVDLTPFNIPGKQAQEKLEAVGIITNRNTIPFDPRSPFNPSGLRLGTPSVTTRGMKEREMKVIAELIYQGLTQDTVMDIRRRVKELCRKY